jgi:hypothetical protein
MKWFGKDRFQNIPSGIGGAVVNGVGKDGRVAEWLLDEELVEDIRNCFKHVSDLLPVIGSNYNTWKAISRGDPVRYSVARTIIVRFTAYLSAIRKAPSISQHSTCLYSEVDRVSDRYIGSGKTTADFMSQVKPASTKKHSEASPLN